MWFGFVMQHFLCFLVHPGNGASQKSMKNADQRQSLRSRRHDPDISAIIYSKLLTVSLLLMRFLLKKRMRDRSLGL